MSNTAFTETPIPVCKLILNFHKEKLKKKIIQNVPAEAPLRVNALRILGTNATRNSFLNSVTSNVFDADTTEQVLKRVQDIAAQLQKHNIFDEIKIYLDTNHDIADTVDVTLHLKEKDKGLFETKVNVGNNQAELVKPIINDH